MIVFFRNIIPGIFFILLTFTANSQVNVRATVDRDKILIGEPVKLTLQAYTPLGETVNWFTLDTIPGFEFIQKGKLDTIESVDNKKLEQTLVITSFDSGRVALGPLQMMVGERQYQTDSLFVEVSYKDFDAAADYKDIKTVVEVEDNSIDYLPWIIGAVTLIAIGVIIWLLRKKKKIPAEKIVTPALPPYEEAMKALEALRSYDFSQQDAIKDYYTKLNNIFRVFVNRKIGISSLEKTNGELISQLKQTGLNKDKFEQLSETLRMTDFVKFAQFIPSAEAHDHHRIVISGSVQALQNLAEYNKGA